MANKIKIDSNKAIAAAVDIRMATDQLQRLFGDIDKAMSRVSEVYRAEAAEELQKKYRDKSKQFPDLIKKLEGYSRFIENAVDINNAVEKQVEKMAQDLAKSVKNSHGNAFD